MSGWMIGIILAIILAVLKGLAGSGNRSLANDYITQHGITVTRELKYDLSLSYITNRIVVDDNAKKLYVFTYSNSSKPYCIPYDKLVGYETIENSQSVGGIRRAIVGGVLAGGVGAIVGAATSNQKVTSMSFIIYQNDLSKPQITLPLIKDKNDSNALPAARNFAIEAGAIIKLLIEENCNNNGNSVESTIANTSVKNEGN